MKYFLLASLIVIGSCSTAAKSAAENGKVVARQENANGDSINVTSAMFDFQTGHKLILSDAWIGEQRFGCDSSGNVKLSLKPGRYKMEARSFGFENYKYSLSVRRGKRIKLLFYLVPYKNTNATSAPFH